jgi:hypothetical protein
LALITWQKKRKLWTHTIFLQSFSPPRASGECLRQVYFYRDTKVATFVNGRSEFASGVFTGKNDPKGIDGVRGVDGRPMAKTQTIGRASMEYLEDR